MKGTNFIALIAVCFVCAVVTDWKIDDFERYLEQKAKQSSISRPKATVSQALGIVHGEEIPVDASAENFRNAKEESPPRYLIENLHRVLVDGPNMYSIMTEGESGIVSHELLYNLGDTKDLSSNMPLHHFIRKNTSPNYQRVISVRIINDAGNKKMWGEIVKTSFDNIFTVELHVNMDRDRVGN